MKDMTIIFTLLILNLISCQERYSNEKGIYKINKYTIEEFAKKVDEKITLYGTLITPKSNYDKILVIVSGTGKISQNDYNSLTEFLLENNIGVFRFDKRGVGKSTGEYDDSPKNYTNDFIHIYSEFRKAKTTNGKKIGFLGHSLGGLVTIQAIEENIKPDFLIQWSTPIGKPRNALKYQIEKGYEGYNKLIGGKDITERINVLNYIFDLIDKNPDKTALELWEIGEKESKINGLNSESFKNFMKPNLIDDARIDNTKTYISIDFPTLVIFGSADIVIDPKQSKEKLKEIGNRNITFEELNGLNHFMTKAGSDGETNDINSVDLLFKKYLVDWINEIEN